MATILLLDDDEATSRAIKRLLERKGHAAFTSAKGADAVRAVNELRFDLVVVDWMMPGMDGLEVLRLLRADPAGRRVPVLLYTAAENDAVHREVERLGGWPYVLKGGGFTPLYRRIEELLSAAEARDSLPGDGGLRGNY